MAFIQYTASGTPIALHVTRNEWEKLKTVALPAIVSGFGGLRVYVTPEPAQPPRWWQRAWEWLLRRWRDWSARVLAAETPPIKPRPTPKRATPDWLFRSPIGRFRVDHAAAIRITSA